LIRTSINTSSGARFLSSANATEDISVNATNRIWSVFRNLPKLIS
jgi:hypothetical protein